MQKNKLFINKIKENLWAIAVMALCVTGYGTAAMAHDKAETLPLQTIIQAALENSPETARIMAETANARAEAFEIETPENPEFQTDATVKEDNATRGIELELEQPLRFSHFGPRGSYADALRRTASLEEKARMLEVLHSITRMYAAFWGLQEQEHILQDNVSYAREKQKLIENAAKEGRVDVSEAGIFKAEALRLEEKLKTLRTERIMAGSALLRMAGMKQQNFLAERPHLPETPPLADIMQRAETETSVRAMLENRKALAERRYAVARRDAGFPEFAPRAVLSRDFDEESTTLSLGLRVSLPVWSRNNAEMIRANAEKTLTDRSLKALGEQSFANVLAAAHERLKATRGSALSYRNSILPEWKKVQRITEKKFSGGQASVFDLWQVRGNMTEVQEEEIEMILQAVDAQIELESLIGQTMETMQ